MNATPKAVAYRTRRIPLSRSQAGNLVRLVDHAGRPDNRVRLPVDYAGCLGDKVHLPTDYAGYPGDRVRLPADYAGCPGDRVRLPDYAGCLGNRVCLSPSSVTFPIPITTRGKIDPGPASRFITLLRRYMFTRPEDLPRARVIWESTAQTNFRKSMWEPGTRQRERHELECARTFHELFDRTHKRKRTDDYVSESVRTIVETYDRTMADRYAEGTPQPDLDAEAWVDAAGGPRKGRVYGFGDSLNTTPVLSSYVSLVAPTAYASSSVGMPDSGGEDMRTLIREELQLHFGAMVEQLVSAIRGVGPSQQAPQDSSAPDDHETGTTDDPANLS
ncbi:hypothetical protein Taro_039712 [Colocasia esculenta]|uniref:Uncharacterized protein n=1 Tax=Colocasia esculenta TaxID=4460 RepID=A0A843WN10_COLES|nr:hypothetical protein [Colocasia esculenta]